MAGMSEDTQAQFIMLSGLVVAVSLVVLAVLINQAAVNGYYSSSTALEFPKDQIRDLTSQTKESTKSSALVVDRLYVNNSTKYQNMTSMLESYGDQVSVIYSVHGETVDIDPLPVTDLSRMELNISYNDGNTYYTSEREVVEVDI